MKHALYGVALVTSVLATSAAMAQNAVTVYGLLDTGLSYTTNVDAAGRSLVKMPSLTGSLPSRIGFRGIEDLGGGLQAIFNLETGIQLDVGSQSQGNRLFGRQASVGLKGAFGTITLGRQVNMTFLSMLKSDVLGPNLFSISSIDPYIPNARSDNAVGYLGTFRNLTVGATYSLGRDASAAGGPGGTNCAGEVPGNAKACRQITGLLAYETPGYGINVSYDIMYGNTGAANGLSSSDNSDRRLGTHGYIKAGDLKIGAGILDRTIRAATGVTDIDLVYLGASYPVTALLTLDAQVARRDVKRSGADATMLVGRLAYAFSKRTAAYAAVGRMKNGSLSAVPLDVGGTVGVGKTQNGLMTGLRHAF